MSLDTVIWSLKRKLNSGPPQPGAPWAEGSLGVRGVTFRAPALLWFWGEPPFVCHPPTPSPESLVLESKGNEECAKYLKAVAVPGRCWGPHGGLEGPRCSQRPCRRPLGVQASRARLTRAEAPRAGGVRPGDHGFTLHSGQSFRGTPEPPGNRTGTRPPSAPWLAAGSAASSLSGRCPPRLHTASAPARC